MHFTQPRLVTVEAVRIPLMCKPTERKDNTMTISGFIDDLEKARAKYGDLKLFVARGYQLYPVESLDLFDCRVGYNEHYDEFFESNNAGFGSEEAIVLG